MIGSGRRGFCQVLAPELRNRNYEPQGKAGKGENGVLPEMKLTGAICQTNEAPTAGILGYHSHRSPAIWNRPFPQPLVARKAQGRITDSLTISTSHRSDAKGNDPTKASSMFNIGSVSTQFTLWSLFILPIWYTPGAAPHTPRPLYRLLHVSSRCLNVDLSVLRANFTGSRRGPNLSSTCGYPAMRLSQPNHDYSAVKRRHPRLSLGMHCSISKVAKLPRYRI
jgi:hypothetical protein